MKFALVVLFISAIQAQTFRPLHVSPGGIIVDDTGKPALLRGVNRSGTGSGNADANSTDAQYAAQNQLLSMNLVRIFVNAAWWNNNVQVPIANLKYQDYIDSLIQRVKKYGNYALILKAGQFPDAPCGANGQNCPAPNQGDLNCQKDSSVCAAQDTTGNNIDTAFTFWAAFAKRYASDPAVLYDTWEDMHSIDSGTWSNDQNELIAAIRTYAPQSLVFMEDTGTAFESITQGMLADLAFSNIVWTFHIFNASSNVCTEPPSPRYAGWSQKLDPLVSYAQQYGHAVAFTEWGSCNDNEPYHTNITSYAATHSIALVYFDSTNLLNPNGSGGYQLTAAGQRVAAAYTAIGAIGSAPAPVISGVINAESGSTTIAPNTWITIFGSNLAPAGDARPWGGSDFFASQMPPELDGVSVTVNGKNAFVYYVSAGQVNVLTPPDAMLGPVQVQLTNAGAVSAPFSVQAQAQSLSFFIFSGTSYIAAEHSDGSFLGPATLYPGLTTPAKPNEVVVLYANGFGPTATPVVSGSISQSGTLSPTPVIKIGGIAAVVQFAGLVAPGQYQFNVVVPASLANGDQPVTATYNGSATQAGTLITVQSQ